MAFYLNVSNSLKELTEKLCQDIQKHNKSVFLPNILVTQTEGMNSWLKLEFASQLGIAANYRFLKPNDLIQQIFKILGGQYQQSLSPQNQCWFIYQLLGEREFIDKFQNIANYYAQAGSDKDLKRLALAEKVADLFDQYQMYRSDMIRNWNAGFSKGLAHEDWQLYLWTKAHSLSAGSLPDKTYIADYIIDALQNSEKQQLLQSKIPRVQLAGISVLTDFHMELFSIIGKYIDLSFYILNPAPSIYWFEDKSEKQVAFLKKKKIFEQDEESTGNALLTNWGRVLQNTFSLLLNNEDLLNSYDEVCLVEPSENTLLHKIQSDLFHNRNNKEREQLILEDLQDGSISIHSCFTPVREIEALYNYLVHLIDQRKEVLSARDIVVMVSDIDIYAPYIKAIFNNSPHKFPFTIADESYTAGDSIASALLSVLAINSQNFKAEVLMQLLDSYYIRKRFGLTDLSLIRKVVHQANFRFGMEGKKDDDSVLVSWKYAAQRILYGICMSGAEEYFIEDEGLFPLDILEGNDSLEIIRFMHFMEVLMHSIEERKAVRTLSEWVSYVEKVLRNLVFDATENEDEDYQVLMNQLVQYNSLSALATEKLSYPLFHHSFQNVIAKTVRSASFASVGITFCSLIPMRSVPFKVVAMLGLNFDQFPRKENQVSFNLIDIEKRKGDRNVKENDKHLFLETIISAQKYLYISYLGQSAKDSTTIPPSALVDELMDYIQSACEEGSVIEELTTRHALHGFSDKYRTGNPKLYSYLNKQKPSEIIFETDRQDDTFDFTEIEIESLINFLKHPIKGYFNNTLSIFYNEEEMLLRDTELFELNHLDSWGMKHALLELREPELEHLKNRLLKTGALPLKNMATVVLDNVENEVAQVRALFRECIGDAEECTVPIDIYFEELNIQLRGTINRVYENKLILLSWSKNSTKYLLEAYIKILCLRAAGLEIDCHFISAVNGKIHLARKVDYLDAKARLAELLKLYQDGHQVPVPYYPDFGHDPKSMESLTYEKFKSDVSKKLDGRYSLNDPYIRHKFKDGFFHLEETFEQYQASAEKLLLPLEEIFVDYY